MTEPTKKQDLVLLPGLACDSALWRAQIAGLADIAHVHVADTTRADSMAGLAAEVLAAAPARFALAGLSMGGYVAQEMLRRAPARITRLALLDSSAEADTEAHAAYRRGLMELAEKGEFKGVTRRFLPMLLHPDRVEDADLAATVMAMAERCGRAAYLRQQTALLHRADGWDVLGKVACPTLILCGREDRLTPLAAHEAMAAAIPGAELVVLDGCGHLSPLEKPDAVTAAMRRWLLRPRAG